MSSGTFRAAHCLAALSAAAALAIFATPAPAALGGDVASVHLDTARFRGQLISTEMVSFTQHDIVRGPGAVVHEYIAPNGTVFAVTWRGPLPPDLSQLFGSYYDAYRSAAIAQSHPGGHRQVHVVQADFVVHALGRLRAFQGMAYVPSLVPPGVDVASLP